MPIIQDEPNRIAEVTGTWEAPRIVAVVPLSETEGNGIAGFDFASEQS